MTHGIVATRRKTRPLVELLEERALLSNLSISLTTDKPVYQPGQPIKMNFAETNTGTTPVTVQDGPSIDGFDVTENGKLVWQSNAGNNSLVIHGVTIQPGKSFTLTKTWTPEATTAATALLSSGTFIVTNQLDPTGPSAAFQIAPALSDKITVGNSVYTVGEPVQITLTETNTSLLPVQVPTGTANVTVSQTGSAVWQSIVAGPAATAVQTLQPGQSITQTATWDGVSSMGSQKGMNPWGAFTVSSPRAPASVTAGFQIDDPLTTILTAGSSAGIAAGLPVTLTFTETNASPVPISFTNLPSTFTVTNLSTGAVVFTQTDSGSSTPVSLEPGQTVARSAIWVPTGVPAPAGSFSATYQDALEKKTTVFQIGSPPTGPTQPPGGSSNPTPPSGTTNPPEPIGTTNPAQPIGTTNLPKPIGPSSPAQPIGTTSQPTPTGTTTPAQPITITPAPAQPTVSTSLAVVQPVHRRGHRFNITLKLTNTSNQTVTMAPAGSNDGFTISSGSVVVWRSGAGKSPVRAARTIDPGQTITLTSTWNGSPNQRHVKRLGPGHYTVQASVGGYSATGTIQM